MEGTGNLILLWLLFLTMLLVRPHLLAAQLGPGTVGPWAGHSPVQSGAELEKRKGVEWFVQVVSSFLSVEAVRDAHPDSEPLRGWDQKNIPPSSPAPHLRLEARGRGEQLGIELEGLGDKETERGRGREGGRERDRETERDRNTCR